MYCRIQTKMLQSSLLIQGDWSGLLLHQISTSAFLFYEEAYVIHMYTKYQLRRFFITLFVTLATNQNQRFGQKSYQTKRTIQKNISVKKIQISPLKQIFFVNFYFSHYKPMGNISRHSNQSSYSTTTKNTIIRSP